MAEPDVPDNLPGGPFVVAGCVALIVLFLLLCWGVSSL